MNQSDLLRLFMVILVAAVSSCSSIGSGRAVSALPYGVAVTKVEAQNDSSTATSGTSANSSTSTGSTGGGYGYYEDPFPNSSRMAALSKIETFVKQYYSARTKEAPIISKPDDSRLLADVNALRNELRPTANEWEQLSLEFQVYLEFGTGRPLISARVSGGFAGGMGSRAPDPDTGYDPFPRDQNYRLNAYSTSLLTEFQKWAQQNSKP